MPEENEILLGNWHSDEWWMHVRDEVLSYEEEIAWQNHLSSCQECREEWNAMQKLNSLLVHAPAVPKLSPEFKINTLQIITRKQRFRRMLSIFVGTVIVAAVSLWIFTAFDNVYQTLEQSFRVIFSARYVLLSSLVQVFLGLIEGWRSSLPFFVGLTILVFMLLMPNSAMVTLAVVWYSRRQQKQFEMA